MFKEWMCPKCGAKVESIFFVDAHDNYVNMLGHKIRRSGEFLAMECDRCKHSYVERVLSSHHNYESVFAKASEDIEIGSVVVFEFTDGTGYIARNAIVEDAK